MTWILPKQLHTSVFVQDMEALTLDYDAASEQCAQSLLVRSRPLPVQTWSKKWSRDSWTAVLFGRILKHFHSETFTKKLISSLEAFHASHSVQQTHQTEEQTQTQDVLLRRPDKASRVPTLGTLKSLSFLEMGGLRGDKVAAPRGGCLERVPICQADWEGSGASCAVSCSAANLR